jgi:hypothetical protein
MCLVQVSSRLRQWGLRLVLNMDTSGSVLGLLPGVRYDERDRLVGVVNDVILQRYDRLDRRSAVMTTRYRSRRTTRLSAKPTSDDEPSRRRQCGHVAVCAGRSLTLAGRAQGSGVAASGPCSAMNA